MRNRLLVLVFITLNSRQRRVSVCVMHLIKSRQGYLSVRDELTSRGIRSSTFITQSDT